MRLAVFFVGEVHDAGFNASALIGALAARDRGLAEIEIVSGVRYDTEAIRARLEALAPRVGGIVFIGGQGNRVVPEVAAAHPATRFAIVQGERTGPNLASYVVRQEDSAYLAGWLAARWTKTGIVGHLSGHRVTPGLAGRAAFAAGVRDADPGVRLLTGFCGTQDDNAVSQAWAEALIAAGADVIFTMLNAARDGAIAACRAGHVRQIGNALDWVARDREIFVASAEARIDLGVLCAVEDMVAGVVPEAVVQFGLAEGDFAALTLAPDVPRALAEEIDAVAARIRRGDIDWPETYDGPEFSLDAVPAG